mmetsp:Transcript_43772/g.121638  ORF Transcript_43772/g.121638 Transcript_43772/m.121638 type:complete len:286 (-) Transcript_43772:25-882(-)
MPATGRSTSTFARSGPCSGEVARLSTKRPSEHAEHQYQGFFRGLGATSKQPICGKRNTSLKRLHDATHFAVGCEQWDGGDRATSTAHADFGDPGIVYASVDAPDKNASAVELRQLEHKPGLHYCTEQRERFYDPGPQPLEPPYRSEVTVHLGDDCPELRSNSSAVHGRILEHEVHRAGALRAAGSGVLIPTSHWPKPVRCDPVTGGPRSVDNYDLGVANQLKFGRITANSSNVVSEANIRNPVLGHHVPLAALERPQMRSTVDIVKDANSSVPPLRSLAAVRPHC